MGSGKIWPTIRECVYVPALVVSVWIGGLVAFVGRTYFYELAGDVDDGWTNWLAANLGVGVFIFCAIFFSIKRKYLDWAFSAFSGKPKDYDKPSQAEDV